MPFAHQNHKNVLSNIFGGSSRPGHLQGKPEDTRLISAIESRECDLVSLGQHLAKQLEVALSCRQSHRLILTFDSDADPPQPAMLPADTIDLREKGGKFPKPIGLFSGGYY
jgi:hypothetical protein